MFSDRFTSGAAGLGHGSTVSRRTVIKMGVVAGGGLTLGFGLTDLFGVAEAASETFAPNAFIRIAPDGSVTLTMPYVEMGQGTYTSIPMLIAEELEVPLSQVRLEHAPPDEKHYSNPLIGVQMTGGSTSIRAAWEPLRRAGATARVMLIAAAAKRWKVDPDSCQAKLGKVVHAASGRSLTYGALVGDAARMP